MHRTNTCLAAATLALLVCTGALRAQPPGGGSPFDGLDKNKDGKLSRDEMPESVRDRFAEIDTNKDGFVSREEDAAFFHRRRPGRGGPAGRLAIPDTVTVLKDINYAGTSNPAQTLDVYLPKVPAGDRPLPVIVNIHGGAFRMGDKGMGVGEIMGLVAGGDYAAISINYRLSGEAIWPAQIHDCKAAIRWVRANAAKYHFDPDRIGVIGGSAGGHLVAMLGTSGGVEALEGKVGNDKDSDSKVRCVVDEFGPSELLAMGDYPSRQDHNAADSPESQLVGGPLQQNKDKARSASPITYITKDDPPFLIFHGTEDPLVPFNQSERLARALRQAGVDTLFVPVVGAGHGGFRSPEVAKRIRQFFDRHLRGADVGTISDEPITNGQAAGVR